SSDLGRNHRGRRAFRPRREPSPTASGPGTRSARGVHALVTLLSAARVTGDAVGSRLHDRRAFRRGGRVPSGRPRGTRAGRVSPGCSVAPGGRVPPGRPRAPGAAAFRRGGRTHAWTPTNRSLRGPSHGLQRPQRPGRRVQRDKTPGTARRKTGLAV